MPKYRISTVDGDELTLLPGVFDTPREAAAQVAPDVMFVFHELFTHKDFRNVKHNGSGQGQANDSQGKKAAKNKQATDMATGAKKSRSNGKEKSGEAKASAEKTGKESGQEKTGEGSTQESGQKNSNA